MNSVQDRKLYLVRFRHESNPNEVQERFTILAARRPLGFSPGEEWRQIVECGSMKLGVRHA